MEIIKLKNFGHDYSFQNNVFLKQQKQKLFLFNQKKILENLKIYNL